MLNLTDHEIATASKNKKKIYNAEKITTFLACKLSDNVLIILIIVKMSTIVGILKTFMSMIHFMLS